MADLEKNLMILDSHTRLTDNPQGQAGVVMSEQLLLGKVDSQRAMSVLGIASLVHWQRRQGLSSDTLLAGTGVVEALLDDPNATISASQEIAFSRRLLTLAGDAAFGLEVGRQCRLSALGHLGMLIPFAATRREVAQLLIRYINLSYTHFTPVLRLGEDTGALVLRGGEHLGDLRRFYLDRDFAFVASLGRDCFAHSWSAAIRVVHLSYPEPPERKRYESFFGAPVVFGASEARLEFNSEALDEPMPQANPLALRLIEPECERRQAAMLGAKGRNWGRKVLQVLATIQDNHYPDLEQMAERFHCTGRTLRRYLRSEGLTYLTLVNEVRLAKATRLLRETGLPVASIAQQLGYSEAAAFSRAFLQWSGHSPLRYRQQMSLSGAATS